MLLLFCVVCLLLLIFYILEESSGLLVGQLFCYHPSSPHAMFMLTHKEIILMSKVTHSMYNMYMHV